VPLRAALEMHECAAALSERWRDQLGGPLALHIGINTGRVVAGNMARRRCGLRVTGDAVNTAARLQAAADAAQTLVSQATYQLTQREFVFEPCRRAGAEGQGRAAAGPSAARRRRRPAGTTCAVSPRTGSRRR
jgi:class 3 adenylate cyclase